MTSWSFDPVLSAALLLLLLGGLFVLTFIMEWRRTLPNKLLRLFCLMLLFLALAGMFFRPAYLASGTASVVALLTKGFDSDQLDSLKINGNLKVLRTIDADHVPGAEVLPAFSELSSKGPAIRYVLGEGLPPFAFEYFDPGFNFLPGRHVEGILSLQIAPEAKVNRTAQLTGQVRTSDKVQWLRLNGPGGAVDSVATKAEVTDFSLSFRPKLPGRFLYRLEVLDSSLQVQDSLVVPVDIAPERKLNVLLVQQFPTFETRYLKNLLADQGHMIAIRSRVSENEYRYEFANRDPFSFSKLNAEVLSASDLLLIDQNSIASLSKSEESQLQKAVQEGLGLMVWTTELPTTLRMRDWIPFNFQKVSSDTTHLVTELGKTILTSTHFRIEPSAGTFPVWQAKSDELLAAYAYKGSGAVAAVLWADSYRLVLNGENQLYANLWMRVVDAVARKENSCCKLEWLSKAPHYPDEPLHFRLLSSAELPVIFYKGARVPVKENWQVENVWEGTVWPNAAGWDSLRVEGMGGPVFWYVNELGDWSSIAAAEQRNLNTLKAETSASNEGPAATLVKRSVPPSIFYLVFLLAAGGLWLAPKL